MEPESKGWKVAGGSLMLCSWPLSLAWARLCGHLGERARVSSLPNTGEPAKPSVCALGSPRFPGSAAECSGYTTQPSPVLGVQGGTWFSPTWRWSLEDPPAVAASNTPSSCRVRNMSPRYQGTEMVMSRPLQDTTLSPLKRWG